MGKVWPVGLIVPIQDPTPFSAFHPQQWREALAITVQHGYNAVELAITNPSYVDGDSVGEALARAGLRFCSITTGQAAGKEGLSLSTPDDRVRRGAVERIQAHMQWAARLGAVVIVGLLRGADGDLHLLVKSLKECAHVDRSVQLALEPLNRYETRLVNTVAEGLAVVDRMAADNLGVLVDTFHANIEEARIGDALTRRRRPPVPRPPRLHGGVGGAERGSIQGQHCAGVFTQAERPSPAGRTSSDTFRLGKRTMIPEGHALYARSLTVVNEVKGPHGARAEREVAVAFLPTPGLLRKASTWRRKTLPAAG